MPQLFQGVGCLAWSRSANGVPGNEFLMSEILKPDPQLGAWEKRVPLVEPKNGSCNDETTGAKAEIGRGGGHGLGFSFSAFPLPG